jgi:hypothetical protein
MGVRAQNLSDTDVHAAWFAVCNEGHDPSERVSVQGMKRVQGESNKWEPCVLKGPRWAVHMVRTA